MAGIVWSLCGVCLLTGIWCRQIMDGEIRSKVPRDGREEEFRVAIGYRAWNRDMPERARHYTVVQAFFGSIGLMSASVGIWLAGQSALAALLTLGTVAGLFDVLWKRRRFRRENPSRAGTHA